MARKTSDALASQADPFSFILQQRKTTAIIIHDKVNHNAKTESK
jgi:hypothetical protein